MIMLAPSSRALVVMQPQFTRVEGADIVMKSLSNSALRRSIESLEDCETRAYILVDVRTSLASGRPAVSAVRSACVRAVAEENREMPALSHIGSRNPGDATCANTG